MQHIFSCSNLSFAPEVCQK